MGERSNQEWLAELQGPERDSALADLRAFLVRGLGLALAPRSDVDEALIEDFVQDALLRIVDNLHTFRGESRLTTWAQKIAVRAAYTELRRRRWQDVSLEAMIEAQGVDSVRQALVATQVHGMPLEEVARRMGSNRNALYRLLHDARQRLKKKMEAEGLSSEDILAAFGEP